MDRPPTRDRRRRPNRPHARRCGEPAPRPRRAPERGVAALDDALVGRLQAVRDYPCASVLMTTAPASHMNVRDAARLDRMVRGGSPDGGRGARTTRSSPYSPGCTGSPTMRAARTGQAIALFASDVHDAEVILPIPVDDRVVVDPTFATRDLVRALARHPRVRVVVASERQVRVLEGWSGQLAEIGVDRPRRRPVDGRGDRGRGVRPGGRSRPPSPSAPGGPRAADVGRGPAPSGPVAARPRGRRSAGGRVEGRAGHRRRARRHDPGEPRRHGGRPLDELSRTAVDAHLRAERREALRRLVGAHPDRCAFGIDAVWVAARRRDRPPLRRGRVHLPRPPRTRRRPASRSPPARPFGGARRRRRRDHRDGPPVGRSGRDRPRRSAVRRRYRGAARAERFNAVGPTAEGARPLSAG